MIKKFFLYSSLLFLFIGATSTNNKVDETNKTFDLEVSKFNIPYLQNNFVAFKEAVAYKESRGNYTIVNTLGYLGKYQFGRTTLDRFKIHNTREFLQNPELQEQAFISLCEVNKWILRKEIKRFEGKTISGIEITESGILAAAHFAGAGNVKKFLRSNGSDCFSDAFGSSLKTYLRRFADYDVSFIKANNSARE